MEDTGQVVEELYRTDSRRIFATLVRLLGDFEVAEEALQEAFTAAIEQWPRVGVPANPRAWLVSAGRFKAIDRLRRRNRFDDSLPELARRMDEKVFLEAVQDEQELQDDRLRLIFTCCHPALPSNVQVALTLREVCGLKTEQIASAFLTTPTTMAQRLVRGKGKIRAAKIPYKVPSLAELPERLEPVLAVIYLVFNEGYSASSGDALTRPDLSQEAIRLGRLLVELLSDNTSADSEAIGLLALMLIQESRRQARTTPEGDLILLEDQDRSLWHLDHILEGTALVEQALASQEVGAYAIQASIAAVHAGAPSVEATDWARIVAFYDLLLLAQPSPVVRLNRAVAIAMRDGPLVGLQSIEEVLREGALADYHLAHAAVADMCRRLGRKDQARAAYQRALNLVQQEPERRFLERRLRELSI